jgi:DNA-directed RNA polymerase subunit K/omega
MASQRAKQLERGARPRIDPTNKKRIRVALDEVAQGLIGYEFAQNTETLPAQRLV